MQTDSYPYAVLLVPLAVVCKWYFGVKQGFALQTGIYIASATFHISMCRLPKGEDSACVFLLMSLHIWADCRVGDVFPELEVDLFSGSGGYWCVWA